MVLSGDTLVGVVGDVAGLSIGHVSSRAEAPTSPREKFLVAAAPGVCEAGVLDTVDEIFSLSFFSSLWCFKKLNDQLCKSANGQMIQLERYKTSPFEKRLSFA